MVERQDRFFKQEVKEITFYVILGIVMTILLPIFGGFGLLGFEENFVAGRPLQFGDFLTSYIVYYIFILGGIGLITFKIREMFITNKNEHPANQSDPKHLAVGILHDPEQDGALYNMFDGLGFKGRSNPMRFTLPIARNFAIAIVIFSLVGIAQLLGGFQFVGLPQIGFQQITPVTEVLFATEPPAFAETTLMLFVFSLMLSELAWLTSKFKLGKVPYFLIGLFVITPIIGLAWAGFHRIVYGNNEVALFATFIFGAVGAFITLLTGTFIYWYVWHFANNFFVKLSQIVTIQEDVILFSIVGIGVFIFLWILTELIVYKSRDKKAPLPEVPN